MCDLETLCGKLSRSSDLLLFFFVIIEFRSLFLFLFIAPWGISQTGKIRIRMSNGVIRPEFTALNKQKRRKLEITILLLLSFRSCRVVSCHENARNYLVSIRKSSPIQLAEPRINKIGILARETFVSSWHSKNLCLSLIGATASGTQTLNEYMWDWVNNYHIIHE